MSIKEMVVSTLQHGDILNLLQDKKIYFIKAENPKAPYIEFAIFDERGEEWAENREIATSYYVQVDIFSKNNYTQIENIVKEKMIDAGFERSMAADLYESDTKLYHKAMRFLITVKH